MIRPINSQSCNACFLQINKIDKPVCKSTDVFIKSQSNRLSIPKNLCTRKGKPKKIEDDGTPAGVAIGLVEIFAGALACILPFPGARVVGGILIGDGARRVADEGEKLDQKNRGDGLWPAQVPRPIDRSQVPN